MCEQLYRICTCISTHTLTHARTCRHPSTHTKDPRMHVHTETNIHVHLCAHTTHRTRMHAPTDMYTHHCSELGICMPLYYQEKACGYGTQRRNITCERHDGTVMGDGLCPDDLRTQIKVRSIAFILSRQILNDMQRRDK